VLEAIRSEAGDSLRRYPSSRADALRHRIAQRHGVRPEQVFVGNGSDEVLRLLIQAYGGPGRLTATLSPTYSLYRTLVEAAEGDYQEFILGNEDYGPRTSADRLGTSFCSASPTRLWEHFSILTR
jgi:histidinol-phosphate aminotransferase